MIRIERPVYSLGRYKICRECDSFNPTFKTCKECGCFMVVKTTIPNAECPLGKWLAVTQEEK